ncbi:MAG: hypothetical protein HZA62_14110 [Rhodocyclales bacterium]|nr:hypothetical protein [Rhodocyclales bacterium]
MPESPYRQRRLLGSVVALMIGCMSQQARAEEDASAAFGWTTRVIAEARDARVGSAFSAGLPLTGFGRDRFRVEQELRGRSGPVSLLLIATESGQEGNKPAGRLVAHEAYADLDIGGERFSVGKKVLSGDVAYGFRPIDVLQRESRLQLAPTSLEGIPMLSWDNFSTDGAWSLVIANPGHQRRGVAREDGSVALKLYRHEGMADIHGVLRHSRRLGVELGGAVSVVPGEALELHASLLQQRRGERLVPLADGAGGAQLLNADAALAVETPANPRKALVGGTWTTEAGYSLLGEVWWDGTAPDAADWQRLYRQSAQRAAMLGLPGVPAAAVAGASAASLRIFDQGNLLRRGVLARLAWSDSASGWSASLDLLGSLNDGGRTLTAAVAWQGERLRFDAGLRRYGGPGDSAFGLLPDRTAAFVGLSLAY